MINDAKPGLKLALVGFNCRSTASYTTAHEIIHRPEFGEISMYYSKFNASPYKSNDFLFSAISFIIWRPVSVGRDRRSLPSESNYALFDKNFPRRGWIALDPPKALDADSPRGFIPKTIPNRRYSRLRVVSVTGISIIPLNQIRRSLFYHKKVMLLFWIFIPSP
jgi:hypothetical protein